MGPGCGGRAAAGSRGPGRGGRARVAGCGGRVVGAGPREPGRGGRAAGPPGARLRRRRGSPLESAYYASIVWSMIVWYIV